MEFLFPYLLLQVFSSLNLHGWYIFWYLCIWQTWMLNLSNKFWILGDAKVFGAGGLGWSYLSYFWFNTYLQLTCIIDASCDTLQAYMRDLCHRFQMREETSFKVFASHKVCLWPESVLWFVHVKGHLKKFIIHV